MVVLLPWMKARFPCSWAVLVLREREREPVTPGLVLLMRMLLALKTPAVALASA